MTEKHGVQSFVLLQLTLASRSQDCIQVRDRMFQCSDGREQIPSLAGGDWPDIEEEVRGHDNTDDKRSRRKKKGKENLSREREKTAGVNQTRFFQANVQTVWEMLLSPWSRRVWRTGL